MPKFQITAPDGSRFEVSAPESASESDVMAYAKAEFAKQKPTIEKPAAVSIGEQLAEVPRQVGLTARYALEGPAQMAELVTEPLRRYVTDPVMRAVTGSQAEGMPAGQLASKFADSIGLPKPQGANERVVGDITRLMAGTGGISAAGRAVSALPGMVGSAGEFFAANPLQQIIGAAGAAGAGGAVREAGGGPGAQFAAAMAGGIGAPMAANALMSVGARAGNGVGRALTPQRVIDQQVDQQIELALRKSGIDWAGVSERVKQGMRSDVGDALSVGEKLDPAATARLLQFKLVPGTQPTRGMLSQDPVQITSERNLAKVGANSTDLGLQKLPNLQSDNTRALLGALDEAGARGAPDAYAAGERGIKALQSVVDVNQSNINDLYKLARDTNGRSLPLEGGTFATRANQLLDQENVGSFLTPDIAKKMNDIATGKYPMTVDVAEQLKTSIGRLQRNSSDGNARMALGLVRQAIDETPLQGRQAMAAPNPQNLPVGGQSLPVPYAPSAGEESVAAFGAARRANREWTRRLESTPALKAVVEGVEPDQFVRKYITGQSATVNDVRALGQAVSTTPEAQQAIKQHLVNHLRRAATGQADEYVTGSATVNDVRASDINNFRAASYNDALSAIGDRKLSVFFTPDEIQKLRAVGNVSNYASAQPAGTAINNSNSGALVAAKAVALLDSIAGKVPVVGEAVRGSIRGIQQRQMLQPRNALLELPPPRWPSNALATLPLISIGQGANDR